MAPTKLLPTITITVSPFKFFLVPNLTGSTVYEKYLEPIRDKPLKMLEIGLGCDMTYGPGKSYYTWLEFLPNVDMYYIEYNKECVEKWSQVISQLPIPENNNSYPTEYHKRQDLHRLPIRRRFPEQVYQCVGRRLRHHNR